MLLIMGCMVSCSTTRHTRVSEATASAATLDSLSSLADVSALRMAEAEPAT